MAAADAETTTTEPSGSPQAPRDSAPTPEPPRAARRRRRAVLIGLTLLLGAAAVATALYMRHAARFESTDDAFIAAHVVQIAPRVPGVVERVFVQDNQLVRRGEPLFELDAADYELEVKQAQSALAAADAGQSQAKAAVAAARAQVRKAQAEIDAAQTNAELARRDLARMRRLHGSGAQTAQALDRAETAADAQSDAVAAARQRLSLAHASVAQAEANIEAAEAVAQQARVALQNARLRRSYARVVAPIDGRVTHSNLEQGDYLQLGEQVLSLVGLHVWVKANFKETQLARMRPGQPVDIEVDAYGRSWHGRVDSFQQGTGASFSLLPAENATGNYVKVVARVPLKIVFDPPPDPHRYLLAPGMSVVPRVNVTSGGGAPMVPAASPAGPREPGAAPAPTAQSRAATR